MGRKAYTPSAEGSHPPKRPKRGAAQYAVLFFNSALSLGCFASAGILIFGQQLVGGLHKSAAIAAPAAQNTIPAARSTDPLTSAATAEATTTTTLPFPDADPNAQNFLITGADNGDCSVDNGGSSTGDRTGVGQERSDSIMVMRVDPSTGRAAVLSFPRDLWVKIDGSKGKQRINTAYRSGQPQKLINTIYNNFGVIINHSIEVNFCAFKTLVDAVGGVAVPFEYLVRDPGAVELNVTEVGCHNFDGVGALAYVRTRHLERFNPDTGKWQKDPTSDFGRISRQQDFLRRALSKVLSKGPFNLDVAQGLIEISKKSVVFDKELTPGKLLEFAGVLKNLDPTTVQTYQIEAVGKMISGNSVLEARVGGDNMRSILAIFKGEAQMAAAPEQIFGPPSSSIPATTVAVPTTTSPTSGTATTAPTTAPSTTSTAPIFVLPTTTLPVVNASEIIKGFVPPKGVVCP